MEMLAFLRLTTLPGPLIKLTFLNATWCKRNSKILLLHPIYGFYVHKPFQEWLLLYIYILCCTQIHDLISVLGRKAYLQQMADAVDLTLIHHKFLFH